MSLTLQLTEFTEGGRRAWTDVTSHDITWLPSPPLSGQTRYDTEMWLRIQTPSPPATNMWSVGYFVAHFLMGRECSSVYTSLGVCVVERDHTRGT